MSDHTFAAPEAAHTVTSERAGFWIRFGASLIDGTYCEGGERG